ncbi:MAG: DUF4340 domain-containing protein [bacterium]|nr:DUF4340 domain-containing protein [bacterium]
MRWIRTGLLIAVTCAVLGTLWYFEIAEKGRTETQRLLDGRLYPWPISEVDRLEIHYPDYSFELSKVDETWCMTAPVKDMLDEGTVSRMLATIDSQDVTRWLPPASPGDDEDTGLETPSMELRLHRGGRVDTLLIGDINEVEKQLWVATSWRDSLALVSSLLRTNVMQGYYNLLDKRPLGDLPVSEVEFITVENARGNFKFSRIPFGWEILRPEPYLADQASVSRLVQELWAPNIIEFIKNPDVDDTAYGFGNPVATLEIKVKGEERLRIFEVGYSQHNLRHARYRDRDQVFIIKPFLSEILQESFSSYMSVVLSEFHPNEVVRIEDLQGRQLIRDMSVSWAWHDEQGRLMAGQALTTLVMKLSRLPTERVAALLPREDQLALWGLNEPESGFVLTFKGNREELRIELGAVVEGRRYFRRLDYPTVYSLPAENLEFIWPRPASEQEPRPEE